jgi:hypothetical protein
MIEIRPWSDTDLSLLKRFVGDPEMMRHLGGPEAPERVLQRHKRYVGMTESNSDAARVFAIVSGATKAKA